MLCLSSFELYSRWVPLLFHVIILNVAHTTGRKNREKPDNFQKPPKNDFTVIYGKLSFSFLMSQ